MTFSPELARRYGRQIRLADVGEVGQAKLCATEVRLGASGFARDVEERYVRSAGMKVAPADGGTPPPPIEENLAGLGLRHRAASEIAEGALRALVAIRAALGIAR
jgi:hypothetical protein